MDARPHRPIRAFRAPGDENEALSQASKPTLHQRHKSAGTLSTMLAVGGLKATAKRTAFGDVSNTARNMTAVVHDDSVVPAKQVHEVVKSLLPANKTVALLRPAQRPMNAAAVKGSISHFSSIPSESVVQPKASLGEFRPAPQQLPVVTKQPINKRGPAIFKDSAPEVELPAIPQANKPLPAKPHPHESYQRPSSSKADQSSIQQLNSRVLDTGVASDVVTCDAVIGAVEREVVIENIEVLNQRMPDQKPVGVSLTREHIQVGPVASGTEVRSLPAPPLGSDIEEQREHEGEEYDEDFATAHSFRSRGDNTTGGMTMIMAPNITKRARQELADAKEIVDASRTQEEIEDEAWDTSMVAEYGDEIFAYMRELEARMLPNPYYMDNQAEIQWSMRSVLMDWLIQVHHRFALLPETLFLCVNYIDRFLSCKVVSLGKLQLVGATAIFVAAKYEEINCPSVQEIVYMVDGGYSVDEILKAERYMLSMLQFELGWPGPMSFLRRISKADDYDLETRTLAKYFLEVTIMDERFVGSPPSYIAAGAHALARLTLRKGDWSAAHAYYSGYTWTQLRPLVSLLVECCRNPQKHHQAVFEKYSDRRYKRASKFVQGEIEKGFVLPLFQPSYVRPALLPPPENAVAGATLVEVMS